MDHGPSPEFLAWMHEQEESKRRPPGIDDWTDAIDAEATRLVAVQDCFHGHRLDDRQWPIRPSELGYTYVVQAANDGLVKIGRADRPDRRLRDIQAMSPVQLSIVCIAPGIELERRWHRQHFRLRRHGEWFAAEVALHFREVAAKGPCVRCTLFGDATGRMPKRTRKRQSALT